MSSVSTIQDELPEAGLSLVSLVNTLIDSFDSVADLYKSLRERENGGWKEIERVKRLPYREERVIERIEIRPLDGAGRDKRDSGYGDADEESIRDGAAFLLKELDHGEHEIGPQFTIGDAMAHTLIQAEIIALQQTTIEIYANVFGRYGKERPVAQHVSRLLSTVRIARTQAIEALQDLHTRMYIPPPPQSLALTTTVRQGPPSFDQPRARPRSISGPSTAPRFREPQRQKSLSHLTRRESDMVTTKTGPTSVQPNVNVNRHSLFCLYAIDLQDRKTQRLADSFYPEGDGRCPYCQFHIQSSAEKTWEIFKEAEARGVERVFHIDNRFVIKCHRERGGFACVLCSRGRDADTVMEDVLSLIDHVWKEHTPDEYAKEVDIEEVM